MAPWCSGYHYCTTSFNKAWTQVLRRFKSCTRRVGDSRWWGSLTMFPAGNKGKCLSSVNHTTKTIHHHYQSEVNQINYQKLQIHTWTIIRVFGRITCYIVRIFVICIEKQIKNHFADQNPVVQNSYKLEQTWWLRPLKTDVSWYIMRIWLSKIFERYKHKYKLPWPLKINLS